MTDLFRFVALRAPERRLAHDSVDLGTQSKFQTELTRIHDTEVPLESAPDIARAFVAGGYGPGAISGRGTIPCQAIFDQSTNPAATAAGRTGREAGIPIVVRKHAPG